MNDVSSQVVDPVEDSMPKGFVMSATDNGGDGYLTVSLGMECKYELSGSEQDMLREMFCYHPPFGTQVKRYQKIRDSAHALALTIFAHCPQSAERTLALRDIQRAVMMANASIAINEKPDAPDPTL